MGYISKVQKSEDEYLFFSECYKKEPSPHLSRNRGVFNETTDGNTTSTLCNHITTSNLHVHSRLLEMKKMILQLLVNEVWFKK